MMVQKLSRVGLGTINNAPEDCCIVDQLYFHTSTLAGNLITRQSANVTSEAQNLCCLLQRTGPSGQLGIHFFT